MTATANDDAGLSARTWLLRGGLGVLGVTGTVLVPWLAQRVWLLVPWLAAIAVLGNLERKSARCDRAHSRVE